MKLAVLGFIILLSVGASYFLTTDELKDWYNIFTLFVGLASFFISIFVVYIAHTVEKHVLAKAALIEIRELLNTAKQWDLADDCVEPKNIEYALSLINAALDDKLIEGHIKEKLRHCKRELESSQPSLENFLNYLQSVVQRINLT